MAPETMRGERATPASDLYSLGMCMYLMLTGEPPLAEVDDVGAVMERALDIGVPKLPTDQAQRIMPELADLAASLSAREPDLRPQDAGAVLAGLPSYGPTTEAASTRLLSELVQQCIRDDAVAYVRRTTAADAFSPEYLDATPTAARETGDAAMGDLTKPLSLRRLSLSDETREILLSSMTAENALSRQREAVGFVLRGNVQDAVRVLSSVVRACTASLGPDHPTTLSGQYWQAVCLARLGASGEAIALFSRVNAATREGMDIGD